MGSAPRSADHIVWWIPDRCFVSNGIFRFGFVYVAATKDRPSVGCAQWPGSVIYRSLPYSIASKVPSWTILESRLAMNGAQPDKRMQSNPAKLVR